MYAFPRPVSRSPSCDAPVRAGKLRAVVDTNAAFTAPAPVAARVRETATAACVRGNRL